MGKTLKVTFHLDIEELQRALTTLDSDTGTPDPEPDEDFEAKKKPTKKAKPAKKAADFDDDELEDEEDSESEEIEPGPTSEEESEEEDEELEAKPAKKSKLSAEDVNDAAKRKVHALIDKGVAGAEARARVLAILQKKFKVKSITALKPDQYSEAIAALK